MYNICVNEEKKNPIYNYTRAILWEIFAFYDASLTAAATDTYI